MKLQLTAQTILGLIIQAKKSGKNSNSRILIGLLSIFLKYNIPEEKKEYFALGALSKAISLPYIFTNYQSESMKSDRCPTDKETTDAYAILNKRISDMLSNKRKYPYKVISLTSFETETGILSRVPKWDMYKSRLSEMAKFCHKYLDNTKKYRLIYTLLEILSQDKQIDMIFYGNKFMDKSELYSFETINAEALLLGLWYQVHKNPLNADASGYTLSSSLEKPKVQFQENKSSDMFWTSAEAFAKLFHKQFLKEKNLQSILRENAELLNMAEAPEENYTLQIRIENGDIISDSALWENLDKHMFLYGSGGMGKTTLLMQKTHNQEESRIFFLISLYAYQWEVRPEFLPEVSCWILMHILFSYYYQNKYDTYETCASMETEEALLRNLTELRELLKMSNCNAWNTF